MQADIIDDSSDLGSAPDGGGQGIASGGQGTVLVTGGTGFIGSYIIRNLVEKGYPVRAIRRSAKLPFYIPSNILEKVEWVDSDILDVVALADAMSGIEKVVHSAALVSFARSERQKMYNVNIEGTANVVNVALETGVKRILHISSVSGLGRTSNGETVTEQKKWEEGGNNTHYGITKRNAEIQVWRGIEEGLTGVIVNPGTVLGFGDWHQSSCALFKSVYREFPWYTQGINGFVGVEDVAEACVRLIHSDITSRRFILTGENWSFEKLFTTIARNFRKRPPHRHATKSLGAIAWRVERLKSLLLGRKTLLSRETAMVAQSKTFFDNSAVLEALPGFEFTPLEVVLEDACQKYLKAVESGQLSP